MFHRFILHSIVSSSILSFFRLFYRFSSILSFFRLFYRFFVYFIVFRLFYLPVPFLLPIYLSLYIYLQLPFSISISPFCIWTNLEMVHRTSVMWCCCFKYGNGSTIRVLPTLPRRNTSLAFDLASKFGTRLHAWTHACTTALVGDARKLVLGLLLVGCR